MKNASKDVFFLNAAAAVTFRFLFQILIFSKNTIASTAELFYCINNA